MAGIWEYTARDNPDAATAFALRMEEQFSTLERYPERCPLVPENDVLGTAYRESLIHKCVTGQRASVGVYPFRTYQEITCSAHFIFVSSTSRIIRASSLIMTGFMRNP